MPSFVCSSVGEASRTRLKLPLQRSSRVSGRAAEVAGLLDTVKGKIAAALAMVACCGLSMAIALGLVAFSSTLVIGGIAVAVATGCVVFMVAFGHGHRNHRNHTELPAGDASRERVDR